VAAPALPHGLPSLGLRFSSWLHASWESRSRSTTTEMVTAGLAPGAGRSYMRRARANSWGAWPPDTAPTTPATPAFAAPAKSIARQDAGW